MKRVVVTGGSGFIGANLIRRLLAEGHKIHAVVRPSFNSWRLDEIKAAINLHVLDLSNLEVLKTTLDKLGADWYFHLAANGGYSWENNLSEILSTNVSQSANFLEAALAVGFEAFVNAGSSSEYGYKDHPPREEELLEPNSHYAVSKAFFSNLCRLTARNYKKRIITLRLYSAYGPFEHPKRLIPTLVVRGLGGELPPLVDPNTARDFVYIDDVIDAFIAVAKHPDMAIDAIYNVGTGTQSTISSVVEIVRRLMKLNCKPAWGSMQARSWDTNSWVANCAKIRTELKWQPSYDLESGLKRFISWLTSNPKLVELYRNYKN